MEKKKRKKEILNSTNSENKAGNKFKRGCKSEISSHIEIKCRFHVRISWGITVTFPLWMIHSFETTLSNFSRKWEKERDREKLVDCSGCKKNEFNPISSGKMETVLAACCAIGRPTCCWSLLLLVIFHLCYTLGVSFTLSGTFWAFSYKGCHHTLFSYFWPYSMWDFISPTKDPTQALDSEST